MVLPIHLYGDGILRKNGTTVKDKSQEVKKLIDDMFETLRHVGGVGLAAHQVGKACRLFVVDYSTSVSEGNGLKEVFINPEIIEQSAEYEYDKEACLSIPGILEEVRRPIWIKIRYLNEDFVETEQQISGFLARIVQHEYDHIDGILFIDRLSSLRRKLIEKKLKQIIRRKVTIPYKTK